MINFSPATSDDLEQITEWTQHDPYHFHQGQPEWWLGADAILAFCLTDESGPLCYVRVDSEGEYIRIHIQFAPEEVVAKRRLVVGLIQGLSTLTKFYKAVSRGFIFNSISPSLIAFMQKQGFQPIGNNDYQLAFEGK